MPTYTIEAPSGRRYRIEAPDRATAMRGVREQEAQPRSSSERRARPGNQVDDAALGFRAGAIGGVAGAANLAGALTGRSGDLSALGGYLVRRGAHALGLTTPAQDLAWEQANTAARRASGNLTTQETLSQPGFQAMGAGYRPTTPVGQAALIVGQNAPNAVMPGSAAAQTISVLAPAAGGIAGRAVGGDTGEVVGTIAGGLAGGLRFRRPPPSNVSAAASAAARVLRSRGGARNVPAMRQTQAQYAEAGIHPNVADLTTTRGRRGIRAIAQRGDQASEITRRNNAATRNALPERVGVQTRANVTSDLRTPNQVTEQLTRARNNQAVSDYRPVYEQQIPVTPEVLDALSGPDGMTAFARARRAASARRDTALMNELDALRAAMRPGGNAPVPQTMSGLALDRLQLALGMKGRSLVRNNASDIASGLFGRQADINAALDQIPELAPARAAYRETSGAIDAVDTGGGILRGGNNHWNFMEAAPDWTPGQNEAARVGAARAIEVAGGNNPRGAAGVMNQIGSGAEQQHQRLVELLGEEGARRFERGMNLEYQRAQNAWDIDPRTGSQTFNNFVADGEEAAQAGAALLRRNPMPAIRFISSRLGMNEQQSAAFIQAVTDPGQTESILRALEARGGPQLRLEVQQLLLPGSAAAAQIGNGQ